MRVSECVTFDQMVSYQEAFGLLHNSDNPNELLELYERVLDNRFVAELSESQQSKLLEKIDNKLNEISK